MFILEEPVRVRPPRRPPSPNWDCPSSTRRWPGDGCADRPRRALSTDDAFAAAASRPGARLYSNSENAIGWIAEHLAQSDLPRKIELFKDKVAFRELMADLYPDYRFFGVPSERD